MGQPSEGIGLKREDMKSRILNYLEYLTDKDLQEISVEIYQIAKRRKDIEIKKQFNERREGETGGN
jgi:hypothetical protein